MKKVVLITGCSSGLGYEMANYLAQRNFNVYAGVRNKTVFIKARPVNLDVLSNKQVGEAVSFILKKEGKIDILINNAGYDLSGPNENFNDQDFLKLLDTNTVGSFRMIQAVYPSMKKNGFGKILNITSMSSFLPVPNHGLYSASKSALDSLGTSLGYEYKKYGINITNVVPGDVVSKQMSVKKSVRDKFGLNKIFPLLTTKDVCVGVHKVINDKYPPSRVLLGVDTKIMYVLKKLLPAFIWDKIILLLTTR